MSRAAPWLLAAGVLLFVAILGSHDFVAVLRLVALAGWGFYHSLGGEPLWRPGIEPEF